MNAQRIQQFALVGAILAITTLAWIEPMPVNAQTTTGSIYGTVADASGAVIPNATVTAKNLLNGFTDIKQSDGSGDYIFPVLAPGSYTVSAQANGFKSVTETGIVLDANQNVHIIFNLPVGPTTEKVEVSASTTLVDTMSSQLGSTIDQHRLEELPLNGRDAYDLMSTLPNVTTYTEGSGSAGGLIGDNVGVTFSMNGLPVYNNANYLDGASNNSYFRPGGNLPPNPDALLEVRVLSSNFDAEFGTMPGAVVNMITRSGTNSFHGLAYDYVRNTILNATTEFGANTPIHYRYNQFGGTFGGPVLHNKLFGFFSYQGLRFQTQQTSTANSAIVPTGPSGSGTGDTTGASPGGERAGDFSTDKVIPKCGALTYPCPGSPGNPNTKPGIIPTAYLDPVALNLLKFLPIPATFNGNSGGGSPFQVGNAPASSNEYMGRGDYQLNDKHRLSYMYFHEYGTQASPNSGAQPIFGYAGDLNQDTQVNDIGTDTWTISPTKLNTVRFYYTGNNYLANDLFAGKNTLADEGIQIQCGALPCTQTNVRMPSYIATGLGNSGSAPDGYIFTAFGLVDTFIWTRGKHNFKFGGSLARDRAYSNIVFQRAGIYNFASNGFFSGNQLADFMMGKDSSFSQNNSPVINLHFMDPALFFQDDWKIMPRLTVNLGLRWEIFFPWHGQDNMSTFIPNVQSTVIPTAPLGVLSVGDPGVPDGIKKASYRRFAPRVGFAYDVFGDGKTSLRGGFGLFYSQAASADTTLTGPLFNEQVTITDGTNFENPYAGVGANWQPASATNPTTTWTAASIIPVDPFPYTPNFKNPVFPAGLSFTADPPYVTIDPYVMEYNLTLEHQFSASWAGSLSYVGNGGRHFNGSRDENSPIYNPACQVTITCNTAATELARRPYEPTPSTYVFNAINEYDPEIMSAYNSLQATLTKRFTHGFSIIAGYVWEKDMDDSQDPTKNGSTVENMDSYNFALDYGKASYDQPQHFVASYVYVSPEIHQWGYFGREALSGWKISGITTIGTGTPFNMTSGSDTNYDGNTATDRPNQVADWHMPGGRSRSAKVAEFFNTAAFAPVPVGTATGLGNTQYDLMVGPGYVSTNLSASKVLAIWKEHQMEFRTDAFNLFNQVNLSNPTATFNSPNDGKITSAAESGRILQMALRYSF